MKGYVSLAEVTQTLCDSCVNDETCTRICDAIETIHSVPAANVEPVIESEWIERVDQRGEYFYDCQKCGGTISVFDGDSADILYKFCPYCGARMRRIRFISSKEDGE